ncbi:MAG: MauE/DoxX family redox-associated membrane protein [Phycisphaerae bacterium]
MSLQKRASPAPALVRTLLLAHVVPWMEFLAGLFLLLGLFTRGAALVVSLLMVGFIAGIASLLMRGLTDVNCPCFGSLGLFCGKRPMGVCHLFRNTGFMAAALVILAMGPGGLALDCLFRRRKACGPRGPDRVKRTRGF